MYEHINFLPWCFLAAIPHLPPVGNWKTFKRISLLPNTLPGAFSLCVTIRRILWCCLWDIPFCTHEERTALYYFFLKIPDRLMTTKAEKRVKTLIVLRGSGSHWSMLDFYLRRSRAGLQDCFVTLLLLLLLLLFNLLCIIIKTTSYKNLYKKVVDPSKKGLCAKFEPDMIGTFAKNCQELFIVFSQFSRFWCFWPTKWPPNSNLTWSAQHNLGVLDLF